MHRYRRPRKIRSQRRRGVGGWPGNWGGCVRFRTWSLAGCGGDRPERLPGRAPGLVSRTRPAARVSAGGTGTPGRSRPCSRSSRLRPLGRLPHPRRVRRPPLRRGPRHPNGCRRSIRPAWSTTSCDWRRWPGSPWCCPRVYCLVNLIENRINARALLNVGHQFRVDFHDAEVGKTAPPYHGRHSGLRRPLLPPLCADSDRRHWSSSTSGSTGPPRRGVRSTSRARQSPAWGVGAWFVPIANYWIPYMRHPRLPSPRRPTSCPRLALVDRLADRREPRSVRPVSPPSSPGRRTGAVHPCRGCLHRRDRLGARRCHRHCGRPPGRHGSNSEVGCPDRLSRAP